jgi:hypothetical protein
VLYRSRTSTPAWSSRAKNSSALAAEAAAVETWRRSVVRGGSLLPWRAALPVSARDGERAAVRSAGAVRRRDRASRDREGGFGRVRAAGQPGLAGGGRHLGVLLLGQREPHGAATPSLVPGPAARPGAGRLAVVTNLVIVKNVRHAPFLSRCQPGANAP